MNIPKINISEIFDSIQGEGLLSGYYTRFVRLQGCRIGCIWCDTKYSWNHKKDGKISSLKCYESIVKNWAKNNYICFTGGEPLEQYSSLIWIIEKLKRNNYHNITIETSGEPIEDIQQIIDINYNNIFLSISPKLPSALLKKFDENKFNKIIFDWYNNTQIKYKLQFKFVVSSKEDIDMLESLLKKYNFNDIPLHLFLQIEDSKMEDKEFIDLCYQFISRNSYFRLSIQQHKIIGLQ